MWIYQRAIDCLIFPIPLEFGKLSIISKGSVLCQNLNNFPNIIELFVTCYSICFPLLFPPHAIIIFYLYYVLTSVFSSNSQNSVVASGSISFQIFMDVANSHLLQQQLGSQKKKHWYSPHFNCFIPNFEQTKHFSTFFLVLNR